MRYRFCWVLPAKNKQTNKQKTNINKIGKMITSRNSKRAYTKCLKSLKQAIGQRALSILIIRNHLTDNQLFIRRFCCGTMHSADVTSVTVGWKILSYVLCTILVILFQATLIKCYNYYLAALSQSCCKSNHSEIVFVKLKGKIQWQCHLIHSATQLKLTVLTHCFTLNIFTIVMKDSKTVECFTFLHSSVLVCDISRQRCPVSFYYLWQPVNKTPKSSKNTILLYIR